MENERPLVALDFLGLERTSCESQNEQDRVVASITHTPAPLSFPCLENRSLPSVAMSLRTRENSAMALKLIFDRINASSEKSIQEKKAVEAGKDASAEQAACTLESSPFSTPLDELGNCVQRGQGNLRSNDLSLDTQRLSNHHSGGRINSYDGFFEIAADVKASSAFSAFSQQGTPPDNNMLGFQTLERKATSMARPLSLKSAVDNDEAVDADSLKKRFTALDLCFGKAQIQDPASFLPQGKGFCSPISVSSEDHAERLPSSRQERLPESTWTTHRANAWEKEPKAQLTIFYSGIVSVYDDIPADKAHAIMLLAGSGSSSKSNFPMANLQPSWKNLSFHSTTGTLKPAAASISLGGLASTATPMTDNNLVPASLPSPALTVSFSFPQTPSSPLVSAERKDVSLIAPEMLKQLGPQLVACAAAKRSHAELPHARKASLARFLEKRKDRIQQVKAPEKVNDEKEVMCSDVHSSPKKQCIRSSSPSFRCPSSLPLKKVHEEQTSTDKPIPSKVV